MLNKKIEGLQMKLKSIFRHPLFFALVCIASFLVVSLGLIVAVPSFAKEQISALEPSDIIALMTGSMAAGGLTALYLQMHQQRNEDAVKKQQRIKDDALRLDFFHEHFALKDFRSQRNMAFVYLSYLKEKPELMKIYARNWMFGKNFIMEVPTSDELQALFSQPGEKTNTFYSQHAGRTFAEYDAAVSSMVSFYVRLSNEIARWKNNSGESGYSITNDEIQEAISPFFWNSHWRNVLMPLSKCCENVLKEKRNIENEKNQDGEFDFSIKKPYFSIPFERLDDLFKA